MSRVVLVLLVVFEAVLTVSAHVVRPLRVLVKPLKLYGNVGGVGDDMKRKVADLRDARGLC